MVSDGLHVFGAHTLNTDASNRSFPELMSSRGLSRLRVLKSPSDERKSGMPAWTEIPAPGQRMSKGPQTTTKPTANDNDALCLHDSLYSSGHLSSGIFGRGDEGRERRRSAIWVDRQKDSHDGRTMDATTSDL